MNLLSRPHSHSHSHPSSRPRPASRRSTIARISGLLLAAGLLATACGQYDNGAGPEVSPAAATATSTPAAAPADATVVKTADSAFGKILTGKDGLTLYGFTNDVNATSTCFGTCETAWPPVLVGENWTVAPGLDSGVFSTIIRTDGGRQLVAGKWPLYEFAGDSKPGDVNGQGSGDVWFVVGTDAKLIEQAATTTTTAGPSAAQDTGLPVRTASTSLGTVLVDAQGRTLYGFTKDTNGTPTCTGGCATAWPAAKVDGTQLPAGLDPKVFSLVPGADGGQQLKAGKWPLYRFSGDATPGDVNGQGSGGNWFVVAADGSLIKGAAGSTPAAPAPTPTTKASGRDGY